MKPRFQLRRLKYELYFSKKIQTNFLTNNKLSTIVNTKQLGFHVKSLVAHLAVGIKFPHPPSSN